MRKDEFFQSKQLSMDIMEAVQKMTSPRRPSLAVELHSTRLTQDTAVSVTMDMGSEMMTVTTPRKSES